MDRRYKSRGAGDPASRGLNLRLRVSQSGGLSPAEAVREIRKMLRFTIPDMARVSGVSAHTISNIESGAASPTVATLEKIVGRAGYRVAVVSRERLDPPVTGG